MEHGRSFALPLLRFFGGALLGWLMPRFGLLVSGEWTYEIFEEAVLLGAVLTGAFFAVTPRRAWLPPLAFGALAAYVGCFCFYDLTSTSVVRSYLRPLAPLFGAWSLLAGLLLWRARLKVREERNDAWWAARARPRGRAT